MLTSTSLSLMVASCVATYLSDGDTKIYIELEIAKVLDVRVIYTDERHVFIYELAKVPNN